MNFIEQIFSIVVFLFNFFFSIEFVIILFSVIIFRHLILFLFRDLSYIKPIKSEKKISVCLDDLKDKPLVNVIIPAWKEDKNFKTSLLALKDLKYPNLKVIINGGGNDYTIEECNSFKKYNNFVILHQKKGEGKNKAINDCFNYVSEGILYIIDADIVLNDDVLLYMIYHLINKDYEVVMCPIHPHPTIINKDLVKYSYINRNKEFRYKYSPLVMGNAIGVNLCITYEVLKKIGRLPEGKLSDDNIANVAVFKAKGFKYYYLYGQRVETFKYNAKIRDVIHQDIRWIENSLLNLYRTEKLQIFKFLLLLIISIYLFIFPFLIIVNFYLFILGLLFLLSLYLSRIRSILFYRLTISKDYSVHLSIIFFVKLIFFIYMDAFIKISAFIEIVFFRNRYKKRKNLD